MHKLFLASCLAMGTIQVLDADVEQPLESFFNSSNFQKLSSRIPHDRDVLILLNDVSPTQEITQAIASSVILAVPANEIKIISEDFVAQAGPAQEITQAIASSVMLAVPANEIKKISEDFVAEAGPAQEITQAIASSVMLAVPANEIKNTPEDFLAEVSPAQEITQAMASSVMLAVPANEMKIFANEPENVEILAYNDATADQVVIADETHLNNLEQKLIDLQTAHEMQLAALVENFNREQSKKDGIIAALQQQNLEEKEYREKSILSLEQKLAALQTAHEEQFVKVVQHYAEEQKLKDEKIATLQQQIRSWDENKALDLDQLDQKYQFQLTSVLDHYSEESKSREERLVSLENHLKDTGLNTHKKLAPEIASGSPSNLNTEDSPQIIREKTSVNGAQRLDTDYTPAADILFGVNGATQAQINHPQGIQRYVFADGQVQRIDERSVAVVDALVSSPVALSDNVQSQQRHLLANSGRQMAMVSFEIMQRNKEVYAREIAEIDRVYKAQLAEQAKRYEEEKTAYTSRIAELENLLTTNQEEKQLELSQTKHEYDRQIDHVVQGVQKNQLESQMLMQRYMEESSAKSQFILDLEKQVSSLQEEREKLVLQAQPKAGIISLSGKQENNTLQGVKAQEFKAGVRVATKAKPIKDMATLKATP